MVRSEEKWREVGRVRPRGHFIILERCLNFVLNAIGNLGSIKQEIVQFNLIYFILKMFLREE